MLKNFVKEGQKLPLYGVGPILLISTESDTVWPSAEQADYIENYLGNARLFEFIKQQNLLI